MAAKRNVRARFRRLVEIDTRWSVAVAELSVGLRIDPAQLEELEIAREARDLVAQLERHLEKMRAHMRTLIDNPYPRQPGT